MATKSTATIKRIKSTEGMELDKRTYAPYVVTDDCSKCGAKATTDLSDNYLSYPTTGEPCAVHMYCDHGNEDDQQNVTEWDVMVVVDLVVTLAPVRGKK